MCPARENLINAECGFVEVDCTQDNRRTRGTSNAGAMTPAARTPSLMSECQDNDLTLMAPEDNGVWETIQKHAADVPRSAQRGNARSRKRAPPDLFDRFRDRAAEFLAQSGPSLLVPVCRGLQFVRRGRVYPDSGDQRFRLSLFARSLTVSQSNSLTLPESTSAARRSISAAQASSAPSSGGPSRLAISSPARRARSRLGSLSAVSRSSSVVVLIERDPSTNLRLPPRQLVPRRRDSLCGSGHSPTQVHQRRLIRVNRVPADLPFLSGKKQLPVSPEPGPSLAVRDGNDLDC